MIRIPKLFLDDHRDRDLDTPAIVKETRAHYWVSADDPALPELASDAEHYASGGISVRDYPELFGLVSSARATLRAILSGTKA